MFQVQNILGGSGGWAKGKEPTPGPENNFILKSQYKISFSRVLRSWDGSKVGGVILKSVIRVPEGVPGRLNVLKNGQGPPQKDTGFELYLFRHQIPKNGRHGTKSCAGGPHEGEYPCGTKGEVLLRGVVDKGSLEGLCVRHRVPFLCRGGSLEERGPTNI